jgi:CP family cyanate transporter-like MFS transporter
MNMAEWIRIFWFYVIGVLAAAQLGKMSALVPLIDLELGLGLTMAAVLISLLEVAGAFLGLVAGTLAAHIGRRTTLLWGIGLLAAAGTGQGFAASVPTLLGWRLLESLGYLAVVIAAPLLIFQTARPHQQGVALALWSSFVPVGLALGAVSSGMVAQLFSWRAAVLSAAALAAAAWLVTLALRDPGPSERVRPVRSSPAPRAWALAAAFGCYAMFEVGMLALLPSFLVEQAGTSPGLAGLITGIASFVTLLGSVAAAWHSRRPNPARLLLAVSILLPAAMLFLVFREQPALALASAAAVLLNGISGIFPGLAFAMLPRVAGSDAGMSSANGLLTQFGASGSLLGPPVSAACVTLWGWPGAAIAGALASLLCWALMLVAERPVLPRPARLLTEERP